MTLGGSGAAVTDGVVVVFRNASSVALLLSSRLTRSHSCLRKFWLRYVDSLGGTAGGRSSLASGWNVAAVRRTRPAVESCSAEDDDDDDRGVVVVVVVVVV